MHCCPPSSGKCELCRNWRLPSTQLWLIASLQFFSLSLHIFLSLAVPRWMGNDWHVAVYERCPATHSRVVRSSNESTSGESPKIVTAFCHQIIYTHLIFLKQSSRHRELLLCQRYTYSPVFSREFLPWFCAIGKNVFNSEIQVVYRIFVQLVEVHNRGLAALINEIHW